MPSPLDSGACPLQAQMFQLLAAMPMMNPNLASAVRRHSSAPRTVSCTTSISSGPLSKMFHNSDISSVFPCTPRWLHVWVWIRDATQGAQCPTCPAPTGDAGRCWPVCTWLPLAWNAGSCAKKAKPWLWHGDAFLHGNWAFQSSQMSLNRKGLGR